MELEKVSWTGERIRALRTSARHSRRVLADRLGVSLNHVYMLEVGLRMPSRTLEIVLDCIEKQLRKASYAKKG